MRIVFNNKSMVNTINTAKAILFALHFATKATSMCRGGYPLLFYPECCLLRHSQSSVIVSELSHGIHWWEKVRPYVFCVQIDLIVN
jgi:hypothetical protein